MKTLRPYQEELIERIRGEMRAGHRSICAVLGCGGGKSIIAASIAKTSIANGNRVLFLVHRKELCDQIRDTFTGYGVNMEFCDIGMVQTITRHLDSIVEPAVIITDESHHACAESYKRVYNRFPNAFKLGFTATPCRMNEGGLGEIYECLVESVTTTWLIENRYLAPYRYFSVELADASKLHTKRGDFDSREVAELMERSVIYGDTVKTYKRLADGKQTIVYCASVEASKQTAALFAEKGITAAHLDAATPSNDRERTIAEFRAGAVKILCNVDLFGEGFDVPDCECVILLRPTKSLTVFIQQSMRSMRYKEGKTAYIIDHVGNVYRHGFPDTPREWTLESKRRKQKGEVHIKQCPECFRCMPSNLRTCPECGYEYTPEQMREYEQVDAELKEIQLNKMYASLPYSAVKRLNTFEELVRFQKAKKYKFAWVLHQCIDRDIPYPDKYDYMVRRMIS